MIKLLFNGNLIEDSVPWSATDRAFQYGDGFFETMLFSNGRVPLLSYHLQRIHAAAATFRFVLQESDFGFLEENIDTLVQLNEIDSERVRAKLVIWRRAAGQAGYRSTENHVNWALLVFAHEAPVIRNGIRLGLCRDLQLVRQPWSAHKTLNALPYVLAGQECADRKLDDLLIENRDEIVTECIESNIFWFRENVWHTPSLSTGCVAGTMRANILDIFRENNVMVKQTEMPFSKIEPERAFTCNATGLKTILNWDGKTLDEDIPELELITQVFAGASPRHP